MHRIDNDTVANSIPSPSAAGTPGYFTNGDEQQGTPPTIVEADWANSVQEEIANAVEGSGKTLDKNDNAQLWAVLQYLGVPAGAVMPFAQSAAPANWSAADGAALDLKSVTTYHALFDAIGLAYTADAGETFTVDDSTDKVLDGDHTLSDGDCIALRNSGGALPGGLSAETRYFVVNQASGEFQLATDPGGTPIDITSTGSGTHTYHTQFRKPDLRGEFVRGFDDGAGNDPDAASRTDRGDGTTGDAVGTKQDDRFQTHFHTTAGEQYDGNLAGTGEVVMSTAGSSPSRDTQSAGGNETRPRNVALLYCIKL